MRNHPSQRVWSLALLAGCLLGPAAARVDAQHGGGGHGGGGMRMGGMGMGGMHGMGGVRAGGYGYNGGFGYGLGYGLYGVGSYGFGYGYYPYVGGYGYYPYYGYGGYGYYPSYVATGIYGLGTNGPGTLGGMGPGTFGSVGPGAISSAYGGYAGNGYPADYAYGYPGGGYYGSMGSLTGLSASDQLTLKAQLYAQNPSRYNLQNAQAVPAYSAANSYNTMAQAASAGMNAPASSAVKPYLDIQNGSIPIASIAVSAHPSTHGSLLARDVIMDADGNLRWPAPAPNGAEFATDRQALDQAVQKVVSDAKAANGRAPVRDVIDARDKLYAYGNKAMQQVHTNDQANASGVARFLNSLDHALLSFGEGPAPSTHAAATDPKKADTSPPAEAPAPKTP